MPTHKACKDPEHIIHGCPELTGHGTAWTKPGQGATVCDLLSGLRNRIGAEHVAAKRAARLYLYSLSVEGHHECGCSRTNLRLTGAPLTEYDIRRIEQCEVKR